MMAAKSKVPTSIDLNDVRRARSLLEGEIFTAVNAAVLKFRDATGLMPHEITIEITRNETVKTVSYLPTGVSAKVDIS